MLVASMIEAQEYSIEAHRASLLDRFRTYRYTTTTRNMATKSDPDSFFYGFFPLWSAVCVCLTIVCLLVSLVGLLCWGAGCSNPRREWYEENRRLKRKHEQIEKEMIIDSPPVILEEYYDDIASVRIVESAVEKINTTSSLLNESRVMSESEVENKALIMAKKKRFMRDHL